MAYSLLEKGERIEKKQQKSAKYDNKVDKYKGVMIN